MNPVPTAGRAIGLVGISRWLADPPVVVDGDDVVVELDGITDLVAAALVALGP